MIRKLLIAAVVLLTAQAAWSQNQKLLRFEELSTDLTEVYLSEDNSAMVQVVCHKDIPLSFSTQLDDVENLLETEDKGNDIVYKMVFPAGAKVYKDRILTISSPGYTTLYYDLGDLQPKEFRKLSVFDPNTSVDVGCYREHRNKGVAAIAKCDYSEARNQFIVAKQCEEADVEESDEYLARIDSLMLWRIQGDAAFNVKNFRDASYYYDKIIGINSLDNYAINRKAECGTSFKDECDVLYNNASFQYNQNNLREARDLYTQLLDRFCPYQNEASARINSIDGKLRSRKDHAHVLTYEWMKDMPIGIHTGKYNNHKAGGFFQLDFNTAIFDLIRGDGHYKDPTKNDGILYPEFNVACGWTIHLVGPLWMHIGPGFTGKFYYGEYEKGDDGKQRYPYDKTYRNETDAEKATQKGQGLAFPLKDSDGVAYDFNEYDTNKIPESVRDQAEKVNFVPTVAPVVGLTFKISYFSCRVSYQYRFAFKSQLQEFVEPHRISIGVGAAF